MSQAVPVKTDFARQAVGIEVSCNNPEHLDCKKYRSVQMHRDKFGSRAAEFYLIAWLRQSFVLPEEEHSSLRVSLDAVRAVANEHQPLHPI